MALSAIIKYNGRTSFVKCDVETQCRVALKQFWQPEMAEHLTKRLCCVFPLVCDLSVQLDVLEKMLPLRQTECSGQWCLQSVSVDQRTNPEKDSMTELILKNSRKTCFHSNTHNQYLTCSWSWKTLFYLPHSYTDTVTASHYLCVYNITCLHPVDLYWQKNICKVKTKVQKHRNEYTWSR